MRSIYLILTALLLSATSVHAGTAQARHQSAPASEVQSHELNPTPSPDGSRIAFTRGGDLYLRNLPDSCEYRLTTDGSEDILNGRASWVYYEEIFGRASDYRAFWWSPDGSKLAFYRFDQSAVPIFPIYSPFGQGGSLSLTRYPKAGQTNPSVRIGIIDLSKPSEAHVTWANFSPDSDQYFGTPFWSDDSSTIYISQMPRRQSQLELFAVSANDGSKRLIYHEQYPSWTNWIEGMLFTPKGLYMVRDFESGWEQIYFLSYDGTLKRLTEGENWSVRLLKATGSDIYFTAKRDSRLHNTLYRLDRKGRVTALSDPGLNISGIQFSPDGKHFSATVSNARTPHRAIEGRTDRLSCRYTDPEPQIHSATTPLPQIVKIQNDGFDLYALISTPKDFDPSRKYPVVMQLYGGPGTPYVKDTWRERDSQDQWCYDHGIIYIVCDPRSSGENGRRGMDQAFGRMTVIELEDYIAWARWLQSQPYIDPSRIGVKGFSFGGTTTAMLVLRYPEYFRCGIAGGGVYDWTLYDSYYTERFMDTPEANPDGYASASVMNFVPQVFASDKQPLPGALRLTHGTGDDNVHYQNTLQLCDALQKAGYLFELMLYPDGMHGYRGYQRSHDQAYEASFWTKWLLE